MFDTITLLTGAVEQTTLASVLRGHLHGVQFRTVTQAAPVKP